MSGRLLSIALASLLCACQGHIMGPGESEGDSDGGVIGGGADSGIVPPACYENRNDEIRYALAGACAGCHSTGNRPFFSSLAAFENGLIYERRYVLPGDPDASLLIALLEGRGSGSYPQMPPGVGFAQVVADGRATITLDELKQFIRDLPAEPPGPAEPDPAAFSVRRLGAEEMVLSLMDQLGLSIEDFVDTSDPNWRQNELTFRGDRLAVWPVDWAPGISRQYVSDARSGERFLALGGPETLIFRGKDKTISPATIQTLVQVSQAWCSLAIDKPGNRAVLKSVSLSDRSPGAETAIKSDIGALYLRMLGESPPAGAVDSIYQELYLPYETKSSKAAWIAVCASFVRHPQWLSF